jgi:3D-(3,5/4)-trihydroxycyclohexane-1,2-dione acylhydrolase (decyclizing)
LRWVTGEKAAVVTSIGPGALQALAASIAPRSDGVGVWYLLGDETTEDEGPNVQQIPGSEQSVFLRLFGAMGGAYLLHTPLALATALRRWLNTVDHPHRAGPFFLLLPLNIQPAELAQFNLAELLSGGRRRLGRPPTKGFMQLWSQRLLRLSASSSKWAVVRGHAGRNWLIFSNWPMRWR